MPGGPRPAINYAPSDYDAVTAVGELHRQLVPAALRHPMPRLFYAILLILAATAVMGRLGVKHNAPIGLCVILMACCLASYAAIRARNMTRTAASTSPRLQGPARVELQHDGLLMTNPTGHAFVRWRHVLDLIETQRGFLIRFGPLDALPIPYSAFPDVTGRTAFAQQIRARIAAAREAQP